MSVKSVRQYLVNSDTFKDLILNCNVKGTKTLSYIYDWDHKNPLHPRTYAPYNYYLVWDIGPFSLTKTLDIKVLATEPPYILMTQMKGLYKNKSSSDFTAKRRGIIQAFLTIEDMDFARRDIDREDLLIAYTVEEEYETTKPQIEECLQ